MVNHICSNCGRVGHIFKKCPTITCRKCGNNGHIFIECPIKEGCSNCGNLGHLFKNCPTVKCRTCNQFGHIAIRCPEKLVTAIRGTEWTKQDYEKNKKCECGCNSQEVMNALFNYLQTHQSTGIAYDTHCCKCKSPYPMRNLYKGTEEYPYICKMKCGRKEEFPEEVGESSKTYDQTQKEIEDNMEEIQYVEHIWRNEGTQEILTTTNSNFSEWPNCTQCQRKAYISRYAEKAKCLYYYENGMQGNICSNCISEYEKEEQFYGLKGVYICKIHNACLVFESKAAKKRFNEDDKAQEEFEKFKQQNVWQEEKVALQPQGEWLNTNDIFNILVKENEEFSPDSFGFDQNEEIEKAKERFEKNKEELTKKEHKQQKSPMNIEEIVDVEQLNNDLTKEKEIPMEIDTSEEFKVKEVEVNYKETVDTLSNQYIEVIKNRDGWKRQYEVLRSENEYHKQVVRDQNIMINEMEQENVNHTIQYIENYNQLAGQYQQIEQKQERMNDQYEEEIRRRNEEMDQLKERMKELERLTIEAQKENEMIQKENRMLRSENKSLKNKKIRRNKLKELFSKKI